MQEKITIDPESVYLEIVFNTIPRDAKNYTTTSNILNCKGIIYGVSDDGDVLEIGEVSFNRIKRRLPFFTADEHSGSLFDFHNALFTRNGSLKKAINNKLDRLVEMFEFIYINYIEIEEQFRGNRLLKHIVSAIIDNCTNPIGSATFFQTSSEGNLSKLNQYILESGFVHLKGNYFGFSNERLLLPES